MKRNIMLPKAIIKKYMTLGLCSTMAISNIPIVSVMASTSSTPTAPPVAGYTEPLPGATTSTSSSSSSSSSTNSSSSSTSSSSTPSAVSTNWSTATVEESSSEGNTTDSSTESTTEGTTESTTLDHTDIYTIPSGENAGWADETSDYTYSYTGNSNNYNHGNVVYGIFEVDAIPSIPLAGVTETITKGHGEYDITNSYTGGTISINSSITVLDKVESTKDIDCLDFSNVGSSFKFGDGGVLDGLTIGELRFEDTNLSLDTITEAFSSSNSSGSVGVIYISQALFDEEDNADDIAELLKLANANAISCITTDLKTAVSKGFDLDANESGYSDDEWDGTPFNQEFVNSTLKSFLPVTIDDNLYDVNYTLNNSSVATVSITDDQQLELDPSGYFYKFDGQNVVVTATITAKSPAEDGSIITSQIIHSGAFDFDFENKDILYLNLEDTKESGGYLSVESAKNEAGGTLYLSQITDTEGNLNLSSYSDGGSITVVLKATPRVGFQLNESTNVNGGQVWNVSEIEKIKGVNKASFDYVIDDDDDGTINPPDYSLLTLTIDTSTFDNEEFKTITAAFTDDSDAQNSLKLLLESTDNNGKGSAEITAVNLYIDDENSDTTGFDYSKIGEFIDQDSGYWNKNGIYLTGFEDNELAGNRIYVGVEAEAPNYKYLLDNWDTDALKYITAHTEVDEDENDKTANQILHILIDPASFNNSDGESIKYTFTPDPIYLIELDNDIQNGSIAITSVKSNSNADIYTSTVRDGAFSLADYDFKDYTNEAVITVEITAYPSTHEDPDDYYYELIDWDIEDLKTNNLISVDSVTNGEGVDEYGNPTLTFTIKPQSFKNDDFDTISASFEDKAIPVESAESQSVSYNMPQVASVSYAMPIDDEDENTTIPDGVPQFIAKVLGYKETTDDLLELEITDTISIYVLANPDTTDDSYDLQEQSKINSDEVVITLDNIQVIEKDITIYEGSKDQVNGVVKPYQNVGTITAPSGTQVSVMYEVSSKSLHASYVNANINVDIDDLIYIKDKETDADSGALGKYFKVPTGANNKVITLYYNPIYDFNGILYETSITPISSGGYVVELEAYGFLKSYMNSVHEAGSLDPDYIYSDEYMYKTYGYLIKAKEYVYLYWDKDGIPSIVDEDDVIIGLQNKYPNNDITDRYDLEDDPSRLLIGNDSTEGYSRTAANLKNATIQVPDFVEKITAPNATTYQLNHGSDNKVELDGDLSYVETGDGSYTNTGIFNSGTTKYVDEDSKSTIYGTINIKLIPDRDIEQTYIEGNIEYLVTQSGDTITVEIVNFLGGPTFINRRLKIFYDENGNLAEQSATTATFEYEEISNYNNIVVPMGQVEGITTISSSISDGSDPIVITFVHEDYETVTLSTENGILIPEENTGNTRTSITLTTNTVVYLNLIDTRIFYTSNDINYIIEDRGDGYKAYFYELNNEDLETITIPSTIQVNTYDGEPVRQGETNNGWENIDIETTFTLDISEVPNIKTLTLPAGSVFTLTHPYTTDLSASFVEGGSGSGSIDDTSSYVQTIFKVTESSNATFNVVVSVRDLSGGGSDGNTDGDSDGNTGGDSSGGDSSGGDSSGGDSSGGDSSGGDSSGGDSSGGDSSVTPNPDDDDDDDDDKDEDKDVYYTIRNQSSSRLDLDVSSALEGDKVIIYYDDLDDDEEISVTTASGTTIKTYTEKSGVSVYFTMPAETVYVNIDTIETEVDSYYLTAYLEEDQGYVRINGSYVSTDGKKISIDEGEAVTLRAYTEAGYIFDSWSISGSARADVKAQLQEQEDEYNDALYEDLDDDDDEDDVEELDIYKEKTIDIIMPAGNFSITANFIVDEDYEKDSDDDDEDDTTSTTPTMPVAPSVTVPNLDYSGSYNPNYSTDTSPYAMILGRYIDVQSHWGKDAIGYMLNRGLFNGTATNQFSPNLQMTRSMFVTVLSRIDNVNTSIMPVTPFTDVPSTAWYSGEVSWAINNRIATGKTATTFEPDSSITREDMALFLYNYMIEAGLTLPLTNGAISFIDSGDISAGASTAVKYMQQAGIIEGKGSGVFDPKGYSTRAEVCALLMRFLEATGK